MPIQSVISLATEIPTMEDPVEVRHHNLDRITQLISTEKQLSPFCFAFGEGNEFVVKGMSSYSSHTGR